MERVDCAIGVHEQEIAARPNSFAFSVEDCPFDLHGVLVGHRGIEHKVKACLLDVLRVDFGDFQINNPSEAQQGAAACVNYLYELVAEGQHNGSVVQGDVRELTSLLWATLHGLVDLTLSRHLREPLTVEGRTSMPDLISLMLKAFAPPAP